MTKTNFGCRHSPDNHIMIDTTCEHRLN